MHQDSNLMASIRLALDNTSWRVALVWSIICALCLACLLSCLACLCLHLLANFCVSWMCSYSSWALAWLASHRSLREGWYPNPSSIWVMAGWKPNPPSAWVHSSDCGGGDGGGLTGRWYQKESVSYLNYPKGTLEIEGMSSIPLPPPPMVAALQIHYKEVASTSTPCLRENVWRQHPLKECPYPDEVNGTSI